MDKKDKKDKEEKVSNYSELNHSVGYTWANEEAGRNPDPFPTIPN